MRKIEDESGSMIGGAVIEKVKGTSQGIPLTPFLTKIVFKDLDREIWAVHSGLSAFKPF